MALNIVVLILSFLLIGLVVIQARTAGLANRDTSSIQRTRRGLEKTLHQTTIVIAAIFLLIALVASLPIFGGGTALPPA
jgi:preprotein translocase subunit SecG